MPTITAPITDAFARWATAVPDDASPRLPDLHAPGCHAEGCGRLRSAFPALEVAAWCSDSVALLAVALSWPRAVRGRTRRLRRALDDAWIVAVALGYRLYVSPEPVPSARELFDDRLIRLPMSPGIVASRAEVRVALTRTVGALGWGLTDGRRAFPALAETVAGAVALTLLEGLGVAIRWERLRWNADGAAIVRDEDVTAARCAMASATARLQRVLSAMKKG